MTDAAYVLYIGLGINVAMTIWVAHAAYKNARPLVLDRLNGNESLADSVHRLLAIGFLTMNAGRIVQTWEYHYEPIKTAKAIETVTRDLGFGLVILGITLLIYLFVIVIVGRSSRVTPKGA